MRLANVWAGSYFVPGGRMTRAQRIVAVLYCLLVVYCCVWVPWHAGLSEVVDIPLGYDWIWSGQDEGSPDLSRIALRLLAATALGAAAFLFAGKWKALLFVAVLAGAGILLYGHWTNRVAERRTQKIHDCAIAKVATAVRCSGYVPKKGQIDLSAGLEPCDNPTPQEDETAIAAAEKECAAEIDQQKSAHEQIEEYRHQHGINPASTPQFEMVDGPTPESPIKRGAYAKALASVPRPSFMIPARPGKE
jgi:hypothetical protein